MCREEGCFHLRFGSAGGIGRPECRSGNGGGGFECRFGGGVSRQNGVIDARVVDGRVIRVVEPSRPSFPLDMYESVGTVVEAARLQIRRARLTLAVAEATGARRAEEEAVVARRRRLREARLAARAASRAALAATERPGSAESVKANSGGSGGS